MPKTSYICGDVIHEDIVNDVKSRCSQKMIISSWLLCLSYLEMELEYKSYTL